MYSPFSEEMLLHVRKHKRLHPETLKASKWQGAKSIYKNQQPSHKPVTERIRGANPFAVQQMKYLGVNLANETEDLYREKLEILKKKKEREKHQKVERHLVLMNGKNEYCENDHPAQSNLQPQCNSNKNSCTILHRHREKIPKLT